MTARSKVLALYKRILTLHRSKLEPDMRMLGDEYVRDEFKRHKHATAKFVPLFLQEWQHYAVVMDQKDKDRFGVELSAEDEQLLDSEQQIKLRLLQEAAKKSGDTSEGRRTGTRGL